jgi:hypothetical protein
MGAPLQRLATGGDPSGLRGGGANSLPSPGPVALKSSSRSARLATDTYRPHIAFRPPVGYHSEAIRRGVTGCVSPATATGAQPEAGALPGRQGRPIAGRASRIRRPRCRAGPHQLGPARPAADHHRVAVPAGHRRHRGAVPGDRRADRARSRRRSHRASRRPPTPRARRRAGGSASARRCPAQVAGSTVRTGGSGTSAGPHDGQSARVMKTLWGPGSYSANGSQ